MEWKDISNEENNVVPLKDPDDRKYSLKEM